MRTQVEKLEERLGRLRRDTLTLDEASELFYLYERNNKAIRKFEQEKKVMEIGMIMYNESIVNSYAGQIKSDRVMNALIEPVAPLISMVLLNETMTDNSYLLNPPDALKCAQVHIKKCLDLCKERNFRIAAPVHKRMFQILDK